MKSKVASTKKRYIKSSIVGLIASCIMGVLTGFFRYEILDSSSVLILNGVIIAIIFNKLGHSVELKFAFTSLLLTFISILLSDIVSIYSIESLLSIELVLAAFQYAMYQGVASLVAIAYRCLSLYIAFSYARIV